MVDTADILKDLNERQREAASVPSGPLLVIAGPGSGKTRTLAHRVARLVETGTAPERILLLTFTRRAAREMIAKAAAVLDHASGADGAGRALACRIAGGTFHSVATGILRRFGRAVGLDPSFTVLDESDAEGLIAVARRDIAAAARERRFPLKGTLRDIASHVVNAEQDLSAVLRARFPWCAAEVDDIRRVLARFTELKSERNVLDYDDLLVFLDALFEDPATGARVSGLFDHVLVDEYQDTNRVQARILRGLAGSHRNLMVVGDDAQSIYSFRSATVRNILDFETEWPGTRVIVLDRNYRSTEPILALANGVMAEAREGYRKTLHTTRREGPRPRLITCDDEAAQSRRVADRILELREEGVPLRKQAVLFRTGHLSGHLEIELSRRNIPYHKFGGLRFVEAAHVKDLVAFLRLLQNPRDDLALERVLHLIPGIGPRTSERVAEQLRSERCRFEALRGAPVPEAARKDFEALVDMLVRLATGPPLPVAEEVRVVRAFYEPHLDRLHENASVRRRDLDQLEILAGEAPNRERFLTDLVLDPPGATGGLAGPPHLDEEWMTLSTIHSAKGCEWDAVFVIHAADGILPSDLSTGDAASIEEERRLFYVALTRARTHLEITFPLRYHQTTQRRLGSRHTFAPLTRFLPDALLPLFDRSAATPEDEAVASEGGEARIDPRARLRRLLDS